MATTKSELEQSLTSFRSIRSFPAEWIARESMIGEGEGIDSARDAPASGGGCPDVVEKVRFDGPKGKVSLFDLFEGRRQLVLYRFSSQASTAGLTMPPRLPLGRSGLNPLIERPRYNAGVRLASSTVRYYATNEAYGWDMPWYTITDA